MIGFFIPYGGLSNHFGRMLDVIQSQLDSNEQVILFVCGGEMTSCKINLEHDSRICQTCIRKRNFGLNLLEGNFKIENIFKYENDINSIEKFVENQEYGSINALQKIRYEDFEVGMGVSSTLISQFKSLEVFKYCSKRIVKNKLVTAIRVHEAIKNKIAQHNLKAIYVHNGRHANQRAVVSAAGSKKIDFYCVEGAYNGLRKFELFKNHFPHDIDYFLKNLAKAWNNDHREFKQREDIGKDFFESRIVQKYNIDKFSKSQDEGKLPDNWDPNKNNIVVFNTSPFEFYAIGGQFGSKLYNSELEFVKWIKSDLEAFNNICVYLRLHPNMLNADDNLIHEYQELNAENFQVLNPDSVVDSYALIKNCDKVATFMSTTGIEAAYLDKPVIVVGRTYYEKLGSTYHPENHEEVIQLLKDPQLKPLDNLGAIKFGFYKNIQGYDFKYLTYAKGRTYFKGVDLTKPEKDNRISYFFKRLKRKLKHLYEKSS